VIKQQHRGVEEMDQDVRETSIRLFLHLLQQVSVVGVGAEVEVLNLRAQVCMSLCITRCIELVHPACHDHRPTHLVLVQVVELARSAVEGGVPSGAVRHVDAREEGCRLHAATTTNTQHCIVKMGKASALQHTTHRISLYLAVRCGSVGSWCSAMSAPSVGFVPESMMDVRGHGTEDPLEEAEVMKGH